MDGFRKAGSVSRQLSLPEINYSQFDSQLELGRTTLTLRRIAPRMILDVIFRDLLPDIWPSANLTVMEFITEACSK